MNVLNHWPENDIQTGNAGRFIHASSGAKQLQLATVTSDPPSTSEESGQKILFDLGYMNDVKKNADSVRYLR